MANQLAIDFNIPFDADGSSVNLTVNLLTENLNGGRTALPVAVDGVFVYSTSPTIHGTATIDNLGNVVFTFDSAPDAGRYSVLGTFHF